MSILCLTVGAERQAQAELSFREALFLGLKDLEVLMEVGEMYLRTIALDKRYELALLAFSTAVHIDQTLGEGWQKMGDVHTTVGLGDVDCKEKAVQAYMKAIELVEGENNKGKIALTLQELLTSLDREEEIEPYRKYLLEQSQTN
mmetsp:Transcript_36230/g.26880  ORF Transcript_36230/g.26880 Transcript_36230/m.26880 type:complete len:145 (+) Transcript_36230:1387-1821(+)